MNCKEAKILLTPALDNELPTTDSARLADHVAQCNGCRLEWNAALKLREGMKSISARSSAKPSLEADTIKALRSTYTRKDSFSNRQLPMLAAAVVLGVGHQPQLLRTVAAPEELLDDLGADVGIALAVDHQPRPGS